MRIDIEMKTKTKIAFETPVQYTSYLTKSPNFLAEVGKNILIRLMTPFAANNKHTTRRVYVSVCIIDILSEGVNCGNAPTFRDTDAVHSVSLSLAFWEQTIAFVHHTVCFRFISLLFSFQ